MLWREIILLSPLKFTEQAATCEARQAGGVSAGAQSPPGAECGGRGRTQRHKWPVAVS